MAIDNAEGFISAFSANISIIIFVGKNFFIAGLEPDLLREQS
jgi:hypothetical protein